MKKLIVLILMAALLLTGCTARPSRTEPSETEPAQTTAAIPEETASAEDTGSDPAFPNATVPDSIVTPDEMPGPPEADAEIPPQPSMDVGIK